MKPFHDRHWERFGSQDNEYLIGNLVSRKLPLWEGKFLTEKRAAQNVIYKPQKYESTYHKFWYLQTRHKNASISQVYWIGHHSAVRSKFFYEITNTSCQTFLAVSVNMPPCINLKIAFIAGTVFSLHWQQAVGQPNKRWNRYEHHKTFDKATLH